MNPLYAVATLMGIAFLMPLLEKAGTRTARFFFVAALAALLAVALFNLVRLTAGFPAVDVATAGFPPPLSINLRVGMPEASIWTASSLVLLIGGAYMIRRESDGMYDRMLFLIFSIGVSGLILTRDLFNLFVFLELTSLGVYGLIGRGGERSLQAGFKYMIAGGMSSIMFLIGTVFLYRITGTLNIDGMIESASGGALDGMAGLSALFFLALSLMVELKPFPANGWALDTYQEAPSGVGALLSSAQAAAVFMGLSKVSPLLGARLGDVLGGVGLMTYFFANLTGLRQRDEKRMFGYSSTGQMGLVLFAWFLGGKAGLPDVTRMTITGGLLLTHLFAKAGLFWMTGLSRSGLHNEADGSLRRVLPSALAGIFVAALLAMPPFPSFFAKWEIVKTLVSGGSWMILTLLFLGSLFEAWYLFGWLVQRIKEPCADGGTPSVNGDSLVVGSRTGPQILPDLEIDSALQTISGRAALWTIVPALVLAGMSVFWADRAGVLTPVIAAPFAIAVAMLILAFLPGRLRGILAVAFASAAAWWIWPRTEGIERIFAMLFLGGGALNLFAGLYRRDRRAGFWAFAPAVVLALGSLVLVRSPLELFIVWEAVSIGSAALVMQGRRAGGPSRSAMLFALGGGYLLMVVLASMDIAGPLPPFIAIILAAMAFLAKSGSLGFHIWLPGAYAEADDDASSLLSAVAGKAGIFMMLIFTLRVLPEMFGLGGPDPLLNALRANPLIVLSQILGWAGALTAFGATLVAVFQEDIKYTLAWSSIGQVGYIILALSLFNHFGWTAAIYLSINHFLFKSMLFLAVAGVILRVRTRLMYKMGGLIVPMPVTFISVLMAIIALSGVPPLSGFGGKWLIYSALIEGGRWLQAALVMFSSGIAFLYLFRLIHSIFLGQRKDDSLGIREAPFTLILPQVILMAALMAISSFPALILNPIIAAVGLWMPPSIGFRESTLMSTLGYWNGSWVMYVTMGVFMLPLLTLLIGMRRVQKVKQFNIVFAAERPYRPETTHYAHNFFAPYRKALGFILKPVGRRFWEGTAVAVGAIASSFRRIYTGNGQTYALHIVLFTMVVALIAGVFS